MSNQKRMNNIELLNHFLTTSKNGDMAQIFVMSSLISVAEQVATPEPPEPVKGEIISSRAMWETAKEFLEMVDKRNNS